MTLTVDLIQGVTLMVVAVCLVLLVIWVRRVDQRLRDLEKDHDTLVDETKEAFSGWARWSGQDPD